MRAEPGNLFFDWSRSVGQPNQFVLLEAFADRRPLLSGAALAGDPVLVLPVAYHLLWRRELICDLSVLLSGTSTTWSRRCAFGMWSWSPGVTGSQA